LSDVFFIDKNTGFITGYGIFKTTTGGGVVSVKDEKELNNNVTKQLILFQNYPNSFNPMTTIRFKLEIPGYINLKIYNLLGKEIHTLIQGRYETGEYKIQWNAKNLPSGIYLYRLQAEDFTETKKLILLR